MATPPPGRAGEPTLDGNALYREEIYTDRQVGTLRVLIPVTANGTPDPRRPTLFTGEAQILTNMGPMPIGFEIEAKNLAEAVANYNAAAKEGIQRAMRELQELRRQASSSIVIPPAGALGGGGLGGGGKIQLP